MITDDRPHVNRKLIAKLDHLDLDTESQCNEKINETDVCCVFTLKRDDWVEKERLNYRLSISLPLSEIP